MPLLCLFFVVVVVVAAVAVAVAVVVVVVVFVVVVVVVVGVDNGDEDGTVGLAPRWADAYLPVSSESPARGAL